MGIFAAILGLMAIVVILANPYFGLILFTSLIYLRPTDLFPALAPFHIARLIAGVTFLAMLFGKVVRKESIYKSCPQVRWLTILVLMMLLSVATSIWGANSLEHFLGFLRVYIGFLLVI